MIVFSIIEIVGDRAYTPIFAEYHIDSSSDYRWVLASCSPIRDGRLFFDNKAGCKAGDRRFKVILDDPNNRLSHAFNFELAVPNKESGLCGDGSRKPNSKTIEFFFKAGGGQTDQVCLVDDLMMDSCITLQWSYPKQAPITLRFPIFVQPDVSVQNLYLFMQNELESEGLYSFIYDELRGVFSAHRVRLEWKEGSTALPQKDSWVERDAIHKTWNWLFSTAIPAILQASAYDISSMMGIERISRIRRPLPSMFRKHHGQLVGNEFVVAKVRRQNFAIPAHIVIVSFLKHVKLRMEAICNQLDDEIKETTKRKNAEDKSIWGKRVKGALRSIEGEIEDLKRIVSQERSQLKRMKDDLRRLESTQVFKESFSLPEQSVYDVDPACFSFDDLYRTIRKRIIEFDSKYYNWHARANSSSLMAKPLKSTQNPGESVYQWKYTKVYQFWCYYHLVRAALSLGLGPVSVRHFTSRDGSWIAFETKNSSNPVRISLFHEVKGYAQPKLWSLASKPLQNEEWCVGDQHDDDPQLSSDNRWKYLTPDFVLKIEGASKRPFLVVLDAKSCPWGQYHAEAQRKYRSFCQYLKGYHYIKGGVLDPTSLVQSIQSWIICPNKRTQKPQLPGLSLSGSWSIQSGRISFSGQWNPGYCLDTSKVGLGCLAGDPSIGIDNDSGANAPPIDYRKPFEVFLQMQLEYYQNEYPAILPS